MGLPAPTQAELSKATAYLSSASMPELVKEALRQEQYPLPVIHRFAPGIYIREVFIPAGTYIIGHTHRQPHLNVMLAGKLRLVNPGGASSDLTAPACFIAPAGQKTAIILEDVVWQNVYATEETDIGLLEELFLAPNPEAEADKAVRFATAYPLHEADREDFLVAIAEYGLSPGIVRVLSQYDGDMITVRPMAQKVRLDQSPIDGQGLFATAPIESGEVILSARINNRRTIAGRYTNHSKAPNAKMELLPNGDMLLVATRRIEGCLGGRLGEEVTIDYRQAMSLQFKKGDTLCLLESR